MKLLHTTTVAAFNQIRRHGLKTRYSRGKMPVIWLHDGSKLYWACVHFVNRHGGNLSEMVTIEVDVPSEWLKTRGVGVWYCDCDIPARMVRAVTRYGVVSRESVKAS